MNTVTAFNRNLTKASHCASESKPNGPKSSANNQQGGLSMQVIATLWAKMTCIYGKLFTNRFGEIDETGMWFEALNDLDEKDIENGMTRLIKGTISAEFEKFPPNPAQFRRICLTHDSKLPGPGAAFNEAVSNIDSVNPTWSHRAIQMAARRVGAKTLSGKPHLVYPLFVKCYEDVCRFIRQGNELPVISERARLEKRVDRKAAHRHLSQIKNMIGAN